ncbi:MAG: SDR family NAD(P)-dependent oxidoreductase [Pseudomonadales bacterium]
MESLQDAVAVITGGAGGIGLALARGAQARGARVVIADVRADALALAEQTLSTGGETLAMCVDVSKPDEVRALADATYARFGRVNLLFNNAGVFASGLAWEVSTEEYDWVMGVNQRSVINGIRAFVPRMIEQGDPCHVTTISSGAGITVNPGFASYSMTKHAVLALTEALYLDLASQGIRNIGVTIVMPGVVRSQVMFPEKTGPAPLQRELEARLRNPTLNALEHFMRSAVDSGMPAEALAERVYDAIRRQNLYVLPNFDDEGSSAVAQAIGIGRATGSNPYPAILKNLLEQLSPEATAPQGD